MKPSERLDELLTEDNFYQTAKKLGILESQTGIIIAYIVNILDEQYEKEQGK